MKKKLFILLSLIFCLALAGCACKEHTWGPWQMTASPSCTAEGAETRICQKCDEGTETRSVPMLAHD